MAESITIFDTTLRDGEQAPGFSMKPAEKVRLAQQLEAAGADVIEAGFPICSEGDFEAVTAVARVCRQAKVAALARAVEADIRRAGDALREAARSRIHVFIATSDIHLQYKLKKTRAQVLADTFSAVRMAREYTEDVEFSAEDATRTDLEYLIEVLEAALEAGATTLNVPDTVGYCVPAEYAALISQLKSRVRGIENAALSVHCHNDLGLAAANTLAALAAGARQVECTVNGIGERAGNAALEEIVMALHVRRDALPFFTNIKTEMLVPLSQALTEITGVGVQPNKAVVGANAFAHEAGIHQDGVLKSPLTYEIMTPQSVGLRQGQLVLGKHSGRHALQKRLAMLGYNFERRQLDEIYREFLALADRKKTVEDADLHRLAGGGALPRAAAEAQAQPGARS
ncbi:MAG TPA: 2-isopropylmalate synthase [Terriglobales bacterium]|nr:2-isopropylmalate synthase [Terriglobales bacterium]